jgi:hypothetical protein
MFRRAGLPGYIGYNLAAAVFGRVERWQAYDDAIEGITRESSEQALTCHHCSLEFHSRKKWKWFRYFDLVSRVAPLSGGAAFLCLTSVVKRLLCWRLVGFEYAIHLTQGFSA